MTGWLGWGSQIHCLLYVLRQLQRLNYCMYFWLSSPLRQYFSLYRTVPQREGEDKRKDSAE